MVTCIIQNNKQEALEFANKFITDKRSVGDSIHISHGGSCTLFGVAHINVLGKALDWYNSKHDSCGWTSDNVVRDVAYIVDHSQEFLMKFTMEESEEDTDD